eukprot:CAMPEP_0113309612 /NCGR_PEP_ID=MMETSP0010_2-20120614/7584_1 /TAXON_ID=216773 ORGANISM="Corethron hystrix, Strain 308" /NCGR_SAMPLE_ID=MMETSP0010_2 /ASSEMBLY_ACC=CAM_ASM_000155 /LENGTH=235 /DNA_ID=CAMNT_0000164895 /DNA_START=181 /DNA_END=888 /DNA_ORIENTATION=+ /assembly_acc=CAM_ASM_000155
MNGKAGLVADAEKLNPLVKFYDPLGLADAEFWGLSNEQTIGFIRESEVKHGRIAMFAFVGYIVHANHITWPWPMQLDGTPFPTVDSAPEAWDAIPDVAKWQIFTVIGFLEIWREAACETHYMNGGKIGEMPATPPWHPNLFDPLGRSKNLTAEQKEKKLLAEINNGRLAMLGIFGFLSESKLEGSVPVLNKIGIPHYDGDYMIPLSKSLIPEVGPALFFPLITFSLFLGSLKRKD